MILITAVENDIDAILKMGVKRKVRHEPFAWTN